jgi:TolB-like protein/Flp pilus assembly protein TadD
MRLWRELRRRNVVRVATGYAALGWMLIEIADTVFPRLMLPGWSVTLVIVALAVGFPIVLVLSWVYEITPEGIQREAHADHAAAQRPGTGRVADYIIIGLLTIAVGYFVVDKFLLGERNGVGKLPGHSIAVMAFEDMSPEGDQGYLSDGIAEELLNLLAQIPELRVISRSSSFSFRGEDVRIARIAETLGVAHVLEGSVRKAGDRVRITAQLIDARTDSNVWSQRYDRTLDDIFAIQDEIATRVVDELRVELLGAVPKVHPTDPEAYDLYLRARERARAGSTDAFAASNELYRQALAIDPDYAAAWAQLGLNSVNQAVFDRSTTDAAFARARQAFERALALDPEHALAHSGLGIIATRRDNDLQEAARRMQQALEYGSDRVTGIAATLLFELDRLELATTLLESVKDRDPLSPVAHYNLGFVHYLSGRWAQSIASLEEALRLSPDLGAAHTLMGSALLLAGRTEEARNAFDRKPLGMLGERGLALVAHEQQKKERYLSRVRGFKQRWGDKAPSSVAMIHAHAGEADAAFEWLTRAIEGGEEGLGTILRDPLFGPVHDDPRWRLTLSRVGRAPEQLARISFDVSHPARERNP